MAPDEKPPEPKPLTIAEAAAEGSLKDQLVAMRSRIAKACDSSTCPPRDLAALSRRLFEIGKELEAIEAAEREEAGGAARTADDEWEAV